MAEGDLNSINSTQVICLSTHKKGFENEAQSEMVEERSGYMRGLVEEKRKEKYLCNAKEMDLHLLVKKLSLETKRWKQACLQFLLNIIEAIQKICCTCNMMTFF